MSDERKVATVELWVCVDADGDWGHGHDEESALDNYREGIGDVAIPMRMVKLVVEIPVPVPLVMTGYCADEPTDATGTIREVKP
jgi:hypothetical protein